MVKTRLLFVFAILTLGIQGFALSLNAGDGPERRIPMTSRSAVYRTVGQMFSSTLNRYYCTATLIGRRTILTAGHCARPEISTMFFRPSVVNGEMEPGSVGVPIERVWTSYTRTRSAVNPTDWAVMLLKRAPLSRNGAFPTLDVYNSDDKLAEDDFITSIGYSSDFHRGNTAGVHAGCRPTRISANGTFNMNCAVNPGASGGPILKLFPASVNASTGQQVPEHFGIVGVNIAGLPEWMANEMREEHHFWTGETLFVPPMNVGNGSVNFFNQVVEVLRDHDGA